MKLVSIIVALALYAFSMVQALSVPTYKCEATCNLQEYKPVCGADDAGETKTFSNLCILKTENCLRSLSFQKTADGECP